jgi:predicted permease
MAAGFNGNFTLYDAGEPERIASEIVSASYFPLLGIEAVHGRVFRPEEDVKPDAALVVVINETLWQRRFGSDFGVIGRQIRLDNRSYTVVGIIPAGFRGMSGEAQLWMPVMAAGLGNSLGQRGSRSFAALARLKPGVSFEQAQAEMNAISAQLEKAYPETNEKRSVEVAPLANEIFGDIRPALLVLLAAVAFVLLIACANVINLLLARAASRQREIAIRTALGAGRGRILRQLTVEGLLLTGIGGALALLVAQWGADALLALSPVQFPSFVDVRLDGTVIAFTLLISITVGVAVGLAPALSSGFGAMNEALK